MRVLLDECVPRPLRRSFQAHSIRTVADMGWAGKQNGELLALIVQADFAAFITVDRNLPYQQDLRKVGIALLIMVAHGNRLENLLPLIPSVLDALAIAQPGQLIEITD